MNSSILVIQPPAGTMDALISTGGFLPFEIEQAYNIQIDYLIDKIKRKNYRFVIMGLTLNGILEEGLEFIYSLLYNNDSFLKTIVVIYTYKGLVGNLNVFIEKEGIILPPNWFIVSKETTYIFEHEDLIKLINKLINRKSA